MKTKLILALSLLTLGTYFSSTVNQNTVYAAESEAKYRAITNFNNQEVEGIIQTTNKELGIIENYNLPSFNDYSSKDTFQFGGFSYKKSSSSSTSDITYKIDGYADDASTIDVVYYASFEDDYGYRISKSIVLDFSKFTNAKTLITDRVNGNEDFFAMPKLETVILKDDDCHLSTTIPKTLKNIVLPDIGATPFFNFKYLNDTVKIVTPISQVFGVKSLIREGMEDITNYLSKVPTIYLIPNATCPIVAKEDLYESGGIYYSYDTYYSAYVADDTGDYVNKAIYDITVFPSNMSMNATSKIRSKRRVLDTIYYNDGAKNKNYFKNLEAENLYIMNCTSLNLTSMTKFKNIYLPNLSTALTNVTFASDTETEKMHFYIPNTSEAKTHYNQLITSEHVTYDTYDASKVEPTIEVEVDGQKVTSTDLTTSYADLVKQAKALSSEEKDKTSKDKEDKAKEDQEAANKVIALIEDLGEISLDSKEAILEAKKAYEALTYDQQQLVENKEDLVKAINSYNELVKEYNKDLDEDEEALEEISKLTDKRKASKLLIVTGAILGTILGCLLIYGLYKLLAKFIRWLKR